MATCMLCEKSGWFLKTTSDGLCIPCHERVEREVTSGLGVIQQSLKIASTTKKLDTMLSRLDVAQDACRNLLGYERYGIPTLTTPPSELISEIDDDRRTMVLEWINREFSGAETKSAAATTPTAKARPYTKLLETIGSIEDPIADNPQVKKVNVDVRQRLDQVRIEVELERAEKLEFKGHNKRACDAYFDALFLVRKDSIPDEKQQSLITSIEEKIIELGGEVPG